MRKDTAIRKFIVEQKCFFLGLVESKHKEILESKVRSWWGHAECDWEHAVAFDNSGGVITCWDKNKFEKVGSLKGDRWVLVQGVLKEWSFQCEILVVYAPNFRVERKQLWDELLGIRNGSSLPLLVMGDFNEVRSVEERNSGASCLGSISEFTDWSDKMMVEDLPLVGRRFTWARGASRSRLDRIFVDQEWGFRFPDLILKALPNSVSDHSPISLSLVKQCSERRPFRNLDAWFSHPGFSRMVKEEWKRLGDLPVNRNLMALHQPIRSWNKVSFGNIETNIKKFEEDQLKVQARLDNGDGDECDLAKLMAIGAQLNKWMDRKASYWQQMARDKWINSGDKNTKYFHAVAIGKRRFKRIEQVKSGNRMVKKPRAIKMEILKFYKELHKQEPMPNIHIRNGLLPKLSQIQSQMLERRPSREEIISALQDCDGSKALGYDGFNLKFVKEMWQDIGQEVCDFIFDFFDSGKLTREVNRTWVTLIPKIEGAVEIKDFRPISMIGSLYKLIAKVLARRLAAVLPNLIGETQSAFVKGRQILDGALIANEAVWWIKKTKQEGIILKLDFHKAYDTIRWDFLEETLVGMGFGNKWNTWIMECVKTASMSILVNGSPTSPFHLQRGLRQGDPLSPFLFLLVAETFNRLIINGNEMGEFKGIAIGANQVPITHLQFADDTVIFAPADAKVLDNYKKFLQCFSLMSGLKINYDKSVLIPLNCNEDWIDDARRLLGCGVSKLPITYLGIPLGANPKTSKTWNPIIDKVKKRLTLWKARNLSRMGRLVLIKAVLNNLPMYYLSLFRMPKKVAAQIIQLQRQFFWSKKEGAKGGNLISWETIQKPIDQGGLGVGDIFIKNASLLFKWWWRFSSDDKPLWKEIVSSIHGSKHIEQFHKANKKSDTSLWGQITDFSSFNKEIQEVAVKGIRMKVGNGAQTRFWLDLWMSDKCLKDLFPRLFMVSMQREDVIQKMGKWGENGWRWKFQWRRKLFAWEEDLLGDLTLAVDHVALSANTRDVRIWHSDKSSSFLVSNFVLQVNQQMKKENALQNIGRMAWKKVAPPRAQLQVWFIFQGRLNTKERLFRLGFGGVQDDKCTLCREEPESIEHLFFSCKVSSKFWYSCCRRWSLSVCLPTQPLDCFLSWLGAPFKKFDKKLWISMFYVISWSIWDIRNKITFQGFKPNWEFEEKRLMWRLGTWVRGWSPNFPFSPRQIGENLKDIREWQDPKIMKGRRGVNLDPQSVPNFFTEYS